MEEEVRKGVEMELKEEEGWEKLLVRVPVRVLLVEGDDSTRQIISVLLRKCGYRVTVASDGLKAWDLLREKDHNIDLVLTEVELPNMSGIVLLTLMMDQDSYNHIPVIMMSSNDSVSIAFKCMIKGAADFLVKPIRKNELKNVWQHVWRKQKGGNYATKIKTVDLSYDLRSTKNASNKQDDMDYAEKESDAQSSCTRSDMEVESAFKIKNNMELKQESRLKKFSLFDETTSPNIHFEKHSNGMSLFKNDANGALSLGSDVQPEGKTDCQELELEESSTELIDLIDERISISENSRENFTKNLLVDKDLGKMKRESSMLSLELSLDRYPHKLPIKHEINDGSNTLHHSNSSAFSLYNNNNTMVPKFSQNNGNSNAFTEQSPHQSSTNHLQHTLLIPEPDGTKFMASACPEGTALRCTPIRLIPFPVPYGGTSFNRAGSNPFLQPIFYPQSSPPLWSSIFQKAPPEHDLEARSLGIHGFQAQPRKEEEEEAASGDSASACASNHSRYNLNENVSTAISNENNGAFATFNGCETSCRSGDDDGFHKIGETVKTVNNKFQSSQREVALNKFRLKRKERCFEKKVRYLSRKKLAEQRPRVKGQFVRQV